MISVKNSGQEGSSIMNAVDPILLALLFFALAGAGWNYTQVRSLNERLTKLEKEYLALVQELEERLYSSQAGEPG
jgi:hypothetical protein